MMHRKLLTLNDFKPTVSFTFDDIDSSAALNAAKLLAERGFKGTFYCSKHFENLSPYGFSPEDVHRLIDLEQEVACHSSEHLKLFQSNFEEWKIGPENNRLHFFRNYGLTLQHFAYPGGQQSAKAKAVLSGEYSTLRGIESGIHTAKVDVYNLKANQLYGSEFSPDIKELISRAKTEQGWLIFYTHDLRRTPTDYGCTPELFNAVLSRCQSEGLQVRSIGEVYDQLLKITLSAP